MPTAGDGVDSTDSIEVAVNTAREASLTRRSALPGPRAKTVVTVLPTDPSSQILPLDLDYLVPRSPAVFGAQQPVVLGLECLHLINLCTRIKYTKRPAEV